jgi:hypothetical protein
VTAAPAGLHREVRQSDSGIGRSSVDPERITRTLAWALYVR